MKLRFKRLSSVFAPLLALVLAACSSPAPPVNTAAPAPDEWRSYCYSCRGCDDAGKRVDGQ